MVVCDRLSVRWLLQSSLDHFTSYGNTASWGDKKIENTFHGQDKQYMNN